MAPITNDILILYVNDAVDWYKYLNRLFMKTKKIRIKAFDLDDQEYENPPEVTAAIKESYLVIILGSPNMMTFMADKLWLAEPLKRVTSRTSVALVLCFVDGSAFMEELGTVYDTTSTWKQFALSQAAKDNVAVVAELFAIVDNNETVVKKPPSVAPKPKAKPRTTSTRGKVKVFPKRVHEPHEDIMIAFKEETESTIQVSFDGGLTRHDTTRWNSCLYKFHAPENVPGKYTLLVYQDGKEVHKQPYYYVSPQESSFTAVEYLAEALQCPSKEALDKKLVDLLEKSIPDDASLSSLFEKIKPVINLSVHKSKTYFPTLLHFAAANGLSEFTSLLLDVPGTLLAFQTENCDGYDPADLADLNKHSDLARFLRDYMETVYLVDACKIYTSMDHYWVTSEEQDGENYIDMRKASAILEDEEVYSNTSDLADQADKKTSPSKPNETFLPPVPKTHARGRTSSSSSAPAVMDEVPNYRAPPPPTDIMRAKSERQKTAHVPVEEKKSSTLPVGISPKQMMGMIDDPCMPSRGALGSKSQMELIEIMDGVKDGTFTQQHATMLFNSWQTRHGEGESRSFKQRQMSLKKMRDEYKHMFQTVEESANKLYTKTKKVSFIARLLSKKNKKPMKHMIKVSDPVLYRTSRGSAGNVFSSVDEDRVNTLSTISSSSSSSRESSSSVSNECFSDDIDRNSLKVEFLSNADEMNDEAPPLPPRTYTRTSVVPPTPGPKPSRYRLS